MKQLHHTQTRTGVHRLRSGHLDRAFSPYAASDLRSFAIFHVDDHTAADAHVALLCGSSYNMSRWRPMQQPSLRSWLFEGLM